MYERIFDSNFNQPVTDKESDFQKFITPKLYILTKL